MRGTGIMIGTANGREDGPATQATLPLACLTTAAAEMKTSSAIDTAAGRKGREGRSDDIDCVGVEPCRSTQIRPPALQAARPAAQTNVSHTTYMSNLCKIRTLDDCTTRMTSGMHARHTESPEMYYWKMTYDGKLPPKKDNQDDL